MFEVKNLSIKIKDEYYIQDLSFTLNPGDKLAIIGEEGVGKSTLLKAILKTENYMEVHGLVNLNGGKIGYLEQSLSNKVLKQKVYDYLFQDELEYYEKVNALYKCLNIVHLKDTILDQVIETLSGGEKVKINILKLLINDYDILFLDEPTNDLDIETLEWLENFINTTSKPILYVSHDETLLNNTANKILHIERIKKKTTCRHTLLKIDYDSYINLRLRKIEKQTQVARQEKRAFNQKQEKLRKIMQQVEQGQNNISRKDPHGAKLLKKKMHSLKSQEKKLDKETLTEVPDVEENINFFFEKVEIPNQKKILELKIPELKIQEKILAKNIELEITGPSHVCMIGQNGIGKSTLIKTIYENLKDRTDIKVGYMPQTYEDVLKKEERVLDFLVPNKNKEDITKARTFLGNMNFTKEEMLSKTEDLSNGTKAKLFLIKLVLEKYNVLILDEPTRNVSPLSNPVIRKVLKEFNGCIISISHDRKYLNEVITDIYRLTEDGLKKENKDIFLSKESNL